MEMIGKSKIAGIGAFLPNKVVYSDDLMAESGALKFGVPINYISRRIGIIERRVADVKTMPSDMAIEASRVAIADAAIHPNDIDLVIYCGIDRDWQEPATSHRVQVQLEAINASCFDVTNACHGFMDGISIANMAISCGSAENVLVCTGEKQSRTLWEAMRQIKLLTDKDTYKRFLGVMTVGDAGGAMIIKKSTDESGLRWMQSYSDGKHAKLCYYSKTDKGMEGQMLMKEITIKIARLHQRLINRTYEALKWCPADVDKMYCHQVGQKPHQTLVNIAQKTLDVAPITYPMFGNLTSATIPVNMFLNRPKRGENILLMGTGSGLTVCQAGMQF